jgi:hypothetical protein
LYDGGKDGDDFDDQVVTMMMVVMRFGCGDDYIVVMVHW